MSNKVLERGIVLKQYINEKDFDEINELKELCQSKDDVNLKLELEFKLVFSREHGESLKEINEFFYYADGGLTGYLGISSFGGDTGELCGMVHPQWRRRGIFTKLLELAVEESRKRGFTKILLLCDDKSDSGAEFIKSSGAAYAFSEYRMRCGSKMNYENNGATINLRKAVNSDAQEIVKQDGIFFGDTSQDIIPPEEEEKNNRITYMIELDRRVIGKIKVKSDENSAFIFGFGILPEFRGRGYGKEALKTAIKRLNEKDICNISLDVACENKTALNLYKSCGFVEESVMNYYEV